MQVQRLEHEDMFDNILAIAMEVVRLLTFQPGRAPPVRGRKPLLTTRIPAGCDNDRSK
jgi:hypothetical protein